MRAILVSRQIAATDFGTRRHRQTIAIAALVVSLGALSACSSGHSVRDSAPTTTTSKIGTSTTASVTLPPPAPPPNITAIATFLDHRGFPIVAFERVTASLASNGQTPTRRVCSNARSKLSKLATAPATLLQLVRQVPDPLLSAELETDINTKALLLGNCGRDSPEEVRAAQTATDAVAQRLKQVGITIT